jgi:hypothetical protein
VRTLVALVRHLEVSVALVGNARGIRGDTGRVVPLDDRSGDVSS